MPKGERKNKRQSVQAQRRCTCGEFVACVRLLCPEAPGTFRELPLRRVMERERKP